MKCAHCGLMKDPDTPGLYLCAEGKRQGFVLTPAGVIRGAQSHEPDHPQQGEGSQAGAIGATGTAGGEVKAKPARPRAPARTTKKK